MTELLVIAVIEYLVFEAAPVKDAGVPVLVVVGPSGDGVKIVERVCGPPPLVQAILKLLLVAFGARAKVVPNTGGLGPVV